MSTITDSLQRTLSRTPSTLPATARPAAPAQRSVQWPVLAAGIVIAAALSVAVGAQFGPRKLAILALGFGLGIALFHSRFGFTSGWRALVAVRQGRGVRAHSLLLAGAATIYAPVLAHGTGFGGVKTTASAGVIGVALVVGAIMFGAGMQIGGSCASGTLFAVGSGQTSIMLTLGGFVIGSTIAAQHIMFWRQLPKHPSISLAHTGLGYGGGWLITMGILAVVVAGSLLWQRHRNPPPIGPVPTSSGLLRVLRGSWPLAVGAVVLAALDGLLLATSGKPWGVTSAFATWGSKIVGAFGANPSGWAYWQGAEGKSLHGSVLADTTSLTDFGIMVGALIASAVAGGFMLHKRIPVKLGIGAVLGGILMGYGARLAGGCNIGAYLSGIASFSLSGWIWGVLALIGTWLGLQARPLFGLGNPKPTDSVC